MSTFSIRLKELRKKRGLTQKELSEHINVSRSCVARYEIEGYPDVTTLISIANFFSVSIDWLLGRSDESELEQYRDCIYDAREELLSQGIEEFSPEIIKIIINHGLASGIEIIKAKSGI